jgi:hypothetical protein
MKKTFSRYLSPVVLVTAIFLFFSACEKPAGYGGTSSISGTIVTNYFNEDYSTLLKEGPAVDEDVFLMFGDSDIVGDKVVTGPEGSFEFTFLRPGNYTVYFMSENSTIADSGEEVLSFDIELSAGEDKDLGTLVELKTLEFDDGNAKISGVIELINYKNTTEWPFLEVKDISFAQDQEVYLIYGTHDYYDVRIRTSYDGYFEFSNLIPGDYKVFTYSEDIKGGTEDIPVIKEITITKEYEEIDLGILNIEQL